MDRKDKVRRIISIVVPIGVVILILSFSYAYWLVTDTQVNPNTVNIANCLQLTLEDVTSAISISGGIPLTNTEGMQTNPYTFKVKNTCNITITANINLEVLNTTTLGPQYTRVSLQDLGIVTDNSKLLNSYDIVDETIIGATSYNLRKDVTYAPEESKDYDLRLWLDHATTWEQGNSKSFSAKIVVIASVGELPKLLRFAVLESAGGSASIVAKTLASPPAFHITCPGPSYNDHENWVTSSQTVMAQNYYLSATYTYHPAVGQYTLGAQEQGFNASHVGWYTFRSVLNSRTSPTIYKVTAYNSGTSGVLEEKTGNITPIYHPECPGIYVTNDDYGPSYYFRGDHDNVNNWVEFAGYYWRIIRIDGNGDIRLIYNGGATGSPKPTPQATGGITNILIPYLTSNVFSAAGASNDNAYVGFKRGLPGSATYALTHNQNNPSNAYTQVTNWYNTYIASKGPSNTSKINEQAVYCGDRSIYTNTIYYTGNGTGTTKTMYGSYYRNVINKNPSLKCINNVGGGIPANNDQYITPVGMITMDEVVLAGGGSSVSLENLDVALDNNVGRNHWLRTGSNYWTMSPNIFSSSSVASVAFVYSDGTLNYSSMGSLSVLNSYDFRPVIALKSSTLFVSGNGTISSPYVVN